MLYVFAWKVEWLEEMNEKPNCLFKQAKKSKNGTLVTVDVPKRTEVLLVGIGFSARDGNALFDGYFKASMQCK